MSASNWVRCPQCIQAKYHEVDRLKQDAQKAYGQVAFHVYEKLMKELEQAIIVAAEVDDGMRDYTFREDYEIYGAETGTVTVDYGGSCEKCGLRLSFKKDYPFFPKKG